MGHKHIVLKTLTALKDHLAVLKALEEGMVVDGMSSDGKRQYWKYLRGYSDAAVGGKLGFNADQIARFRKEHGDKHFNPAVNGRHNGNLTAGFGGWNKRLVDLEEKLRAEFRHESGKLHQDVQRLTRVIEALEEAITKPARQAT